MKIEFRESFAKDLKAVSEKSVLKKVEQLIKIIEKAKNSHEIPGIKKLSRSKNYFRIRIGNYRIGIFIVNDIITFVRILHRKEIYRFFP